MGWLPIETAPKDKQILLIDADGPAVIVVGEWAGSRWIVSWDGHDFEKKLDATHWAPIPGREDGSFDDGWNAAAQVCESIADEIAAEFEGKDDGHDGVADYIANQIRLRLQAIEPA